jgi:pseudouridine kinase
VARNVAENLARLGHPSVLLTAVGHDATGDQLIDQGSAAGIDMQHLLRTTDQPTGTYFALVNDEGRLQYALDDMRVLSSITPAYLDGKSWLFENASLVFIDANLTKQALRKVFSLARKANIPVCADPTSSTLAPRLSSYIPRLKMITPNIDEAEILCGFTIDRTSRENALDAVKCLVSNGVGLAIIALAEYGVCYATSETSGYVPAIATDVKDPTGGGDALSSAVIFALLNGISLDDAIRLGISASSLTLRHSGTVIPDLTLEKLYDHLVI